MFERPTAFASDKKLIAAGGVIQVMNSKVLCQNVPVENKTSSWLVTFQRIEYLRTFICERLGWSYLDSTILISGAFCMVKKEAIERVGGLIDRELTEEERVLFDSFEFMNHQQLFGDWGH